MIREQVALQQEGEEIIHNQDQCLTARDPFRLTVMVIQIGINIATMMKILAMNEPVAFELMKANIINNHIPENIN